MTLLTESQNIPYLTSSEEKYMLTTSKILFVNVSYNNYKVEEFNFTSKYV